MELYKDGDIEILRLGPLGPYGNNAYIITDGSSKQTAIVDMPEGSEAVVEALGNANVSAIIATHWHPDHWAGYDVIRAVTKAPVHVHAAEINIPAERIDKRVDDGQDIMLGTARIRVIHTPGHTPGSMSLKLGKVLLTGDALFPGGPGRTRTPEDLQTALRSIAERMLVLDENTLIWPGHGDPGQIGPVKVDYQRFMARAHRPDLAGDVSWDMAE